MHLPHHPRLPNQVFSLSHWLKQINSQTYLHLGQTCYRFVSSQALSPVSGCLGTPETRALSCRSSSQTKTFCKQAYHQIASTQAMLTPQHSSRFLLSSLSDAAARSWLSCNKMQRLHRKITRQMRTGSPWQLHSMWLTAYPHV